MSTELVTLLIEIAVKSTLLLGVVWLIGALLARHLSAGERHGLWASAMLGLLLLPAAVLLGPRVELATADVAASFDIGRTATDDAALAAAASPAADTEAQTRPRTSAAQDRISGGGPATELGRIALGNGGGRTAPLIVAVYVTLASLLLMRLGVAIVQVWRSLSKLEPARDRNVLALLEEIREQAAVRRPVELKVSATDVTPWAWGWRRPVIVVPATFMQWPVSAQRFALLHEVSHIARLDFLTGLIGQVCRALYWFQPLAWLAIRRLDQEAERACDDRVVLAGGNSRAYAALLLDLAATIRGAHGTRLLTCAMAKSSGLSHRITALLHTHRRRTTMGRVKSLVALSLIAALVLPLGALKSQDATVTPATPTILDPADPDLVALLARGPADSDELETVVMSLLEHGREADAVGVLANFIWPYDYGAAAFTAGEERTKLDCNFCSVVLTTVNTGARHAALPALLAAFDEIEQRAVEAADGNPLVRMAAVAGDASRQGHGVFYLFEGFRLGNLTDEAKLEAVAFLYGIHWYEPARALVEQLREDTSSSLHDSAELRQWRWYLDNQLSLMREVSAVLGTQDAPLSGRRDFLPLIRVAPSYPEAAATAGLEGHVDVEFTINARGRPEDLTVIQSSDPVFEQPALQAARQFRYVPRIAGGVPTEVRGVQNRFTFVME